jgi:hypothetical protein
MPELTVKDLLELVVFAKQQGCWLLVAGCWLLVAGCWLRMRRKLSRAGA